MADPGFPPQHTTTTTVHTVNTGIRFDTTYFRTLPGILKCVQMALGIIGFICIECSGANFSTNTRGSFFTFVAMFSFWFTGILLGFYLFHIIERCHKMPWLKIEFVYCAVWTGLYLIASSLAAATSALEAFVAAGFFGFCAMVAYGIDAFLKFRAIQSGQLAQGEKITISSPGY